MKPMSLAGDTFSRAKSANYIKRTGLYVLLDELRDRDVTRMDNEYT